MYDPAAGIDPKILSAVITVIGAVIAVTIGARYAYRHAREHNRRAHTVAMQVDRLRREIDALERVWGLLAYMTLGENALAIVSYREDAQQRRTYCVNVENLRQFVRQALPQAFYADHAGLYVPKEIRDRLFDYNGSLIGLYLRYEHQDAAEAAGPVTLENPHLIDKLRAGYDDLNRELKAALEQRYAEMLASD